MLRQQVSHWLKRDKEPLFHFMRQWEECSQSWCFVGVRVRMRLFSAANSHSKNQIWNFCLAFFFFRLQTYRVTSSWRSCQETVLLGINRVHTLMSVDTMSPTVTQIKSQPPCLPLLYPPAPSSWVRLLVRCSAMFWVTQPQENKATFTFASLGQM